MAKILATLTTRQMKPNHEMSKERSEGFKEGFECAKKLYKLTEDEEDWERIKEEEQNDIYDNPRERNEYGEFEDE